MKTTTDFTREKCLHSLGVANFMRAWAPKLKLNPESAWIIGYVHDIGCIVDSKNHSMHGKDIMSKFSDKLSTYIGRHDSDDIKDDMEFLLKVADYTIDHEGNYVGITARRNSICMRDGNAVSDILDRQISNLKRYAEEKGYTEIIEVCK